MLLEKIKPRDYQKAISKTGIDKNCLIVLPTGLGKTLIALIIAIERIKIYPEEKVLILAPTKPLVEQHLKSFKENLPELFGDLQLFTGLVPAKKRKKLFQMADIIFSTPQCIANDLKKGLYNLEDVCLLVEDEAHRCVKNYDYNFIAKRYFEQSKHQRLIGLTASPGSSQKKIKEICKNLQIKEVELRTRDSPDVKKYLQELEFEKIEVKLPPKIIEIKSILKRIYEFYIEDLKKRNFIFGPINKITLINLQKRLINQIGRNYVNPESYIAMSSCAQAIKISHAIELLETQTIESFRTYLKKLYAQAEKKQSKGVIRLVAKPEFNIAFAAANEILLKNEEHPKMKEVIRIIKEEQQKNENIKILLFTQFRETAKLISKKINMIDGINAKVFVGQTKKEGSGLSQKEQKQMIEEFSDGKLNVLCATCIAEEGLDIPEVNVVLFYEPVSSAIRSIQRRGRTARLSKGKLIILITKDTKDEFSYYASRSREKKMAKSIEEIRKEMNSKKTDLNEKVTQGKLF